MKNLIRINYKDGVKSSWNELNIGATDIISSDIPYYFELLKEDENSWVLKTEFINSGEAMHAIAESDLQILVGDKSGKVYEVRWEKPLEYFDIRDLTNTFRDMVAREKSNSEPKSHRKLNNLKFFMKWIPEAIRKLKEAYKLDPLGYSEFEATHVEH